MRFALLVLLLTWRANAQQCEYPIADLTSCPARTARAGHMPTVNGCGPAWFPAGLKVPQGSGIADYEQACNAHDVCYETCNSSQTKCDDDLENQMKSNCRAAYPRPASGEDEEQPHRGTCLSRAHLYGRAVKRAGQGAYNNAQKVACECCQCAEIQFLLVNEGNATLKLVGCFGDKQGKVTVGGQDRPIQSWASGAVVCSLPSTGPGSNGDVVVEVPALTNGTRLSNVRQLTEWDIPLKYLWTNPYNQLGWKFEGNAIFRYRADVAGYLANGASTPAFPVRGMSPTLESALPITGSGTASDSTCSKVLSGAGTFVSSPVGPPTLVIGAMMKVDTGTRQGALGLALGATSATLPFISTNSGAGCDPPFQVVCTFGTLVGPEYFPSPSGDGVSIGPISAFPIAFDSQFRLTKKKFIETRLGGTMSIEWQQDVEPIAPPR